MSTHHLRNHTKKKMFCLSHCMHIARHSNTILMCNIFQFTSRGRLSGDILMYYYLRLLRGTTNNSTKIRDNLRLFLKNEAELGACTLYIYIFAVVSSIWTSGQNYPGSTRSVSRLLSFARYTYPVLSHPNIPTLVYSELVCSIRI